jgi:hypothetical protein
LPRKLPSISPDLARDPDYRLAAEVRPAGDDSTAKLMEKFAADESTSLFGTLSL